MFASESACRAFASAWRALFLRCGLHGRSHDRSRTKQALRSYVRGAVYRLAGICRRPVGWPRPGFIEQFHVFVCIGVCPVAHVGMHIKQEFVTEEASDGLKKFHFTGYISTRHCNEDVL